MIKKWVIEAVVYLLLVMIGYAIYTYLVNPEPMDMGKHGDGSFVSMMEESTGTLASKWKLK